MSALDPRRSAAVRAVRRALKEAQEAVPLTLSVPEAGKKYFGLSKNGSYDAADRGEIPTIKIGKLRRVPGRPVGTNLHAAGGRVRPPHKNKPPPVPAAALFLRRGARAGAECRVCTSPLAP